MIQCSTIAELKHIIADFRQSKPEGIIGLVPTMGFLHKGHASLMRKSQAQCDLTIVSIFVNPLQFGPNEDFDKYPRDLERDHQLAQSEGVHVLFTPTVEEMYPKPVLTKVLISNITDRLCGASRPGHFDGVGTVVSKLFNIASPDKTFFGMKDAQQVAVITRMTEDLNIPVEIIPVPTVREPDGLALSSRNVYLTQAERQQAVILNDTLELAGTLLRQPGITLEKILDELKQNVRQSSLAVIDYIELVTFPDLEPPAAEDDLSQHADPLMVALAIKFGNTRLIDNRLFTRDEVMGHV
ncbi:pantoate--beta-alanine ligase [Paenibacillaceae bacterium]|nr:pantoate--beta-alanine ligase [Paenibacillaceae bacterium]